MEMSSKMAPIIVDMLKCFFQPTEKLPVSRNMAKFYGARVVNLPETLAIIKKAV